MHPEITKLLRERKKETGKETEKEKNISREPEKSATNLFDADAQETPEKASELQLDPLQLDPLQLDPKKLSADALFNLVENLIQNGSKEDFEKAYALLNLNLESLVSHVNRYGLGILDAVLGRYSHHTERYVREFEKTEHCNFFENFFRLSLQNGFNPLRCKLKFGTTVSYLEYTSLLNFLTNVYHAVHQALGPKKEIDNSFASCFIHLLDFGAGLLRFETRHSDKLKPLLDVTGAFVMDSGHDIGTKPKGFEFYFEAPIVVIGVRIKDNKRVWIYSPKVLEEILSGTRQDIVLPHLDQIAVNVFQTEEHHLAEGVRELFIKYKKNLDVHRSPSVSDTQYYLDFKQAIMKLSVLPLRSISENGYYDFPSHRISEKSNLVSYDITCYEPWLYHNITEVLQMLAIKNAEVSFFKLIRKYHAMLGEKHFFNFIKEQDEAFFKVVGRLLLFYSIRKCEYEIIEYLINDKRLALNVTLGKIENSVLIELAISTNFRDPGITLEILSCLLDQAGVAAGSLASYSNEQGDTALHFFTAKSGHEACIATLLQAGASRCIINRAGETPLSNVLRHYDDFQYAMMLLFRFGGGLVAREYRFFCDSMKCDIERGLKKLHEERISICNREKAENVIHLSPQEFRQKRFDEHYYESDFLLAESGLQLKEYFKFSNNLKLLAKSLFGNDVVLEEHEKRKEEDSLLLENLGLIRGHVLNADEFLISPGIRKLFEEENVACVKLGEMLAQFLTCDKEVSDIVTSYLCNGLTVTKSLEFFTKKAKNSKEGLGSSSLFKEITKDFPLPQLPREKFIHEQWKAWRWQQINGNNIFGQYDSEVDQLLMRNDKDPSNVSKLQRLIDDNGLLVRMMLVLVGRNFFSKCIIQKKFEFLKILVNAGLKLGVLGAYIQINGALHYALEREDRATALLLIDAGADLTAPEVGVRHYEEMFKRTHPRSPRSPKFMKEMTEVIAKKKNFPALLDPTGMIEGNFKAILEKPEDDPKNLLTFRRFAEERLLAYNFFHPEGAMFRLIHDHKSRLLEILIDAKADVNAEFSPKLKLPFTYAIEVGDLDCIEVLIDRGAQLNETSPFAKTTGERAVERSQKPGCEYFMRDLLELLKKKGKAETDLWSRPSHARKMKENEEMPGALLPLFTAGQDQEPAESSLSPSSSSSSSTFTRWFF